MVMPDHWNQTGDGMAEFVSELDSFLCNMLGEDARLPGVLVSDGGPCFYQTTTGHIVKHIAALLPPKTQRFSQDANKHPPDMTNFWPLFPA